MITQHKLSLFIFIDAFGWELLRRHSFLDDILPVKAPLATVLGYSSTCIPTILTGVSPREHGHFSFFYYQPTTSPFGPCRWLSLFPTSLTRRGRVRHLLSKALQRYYGYTGYFQLYNMPFRHLPLFDYSEKRDLYAPSGMNNGVPTIFDTLRGRQIPFHVSDWRASEQTNLSALEEALQGQSISFAYVYLAALDALLHAHGTQASVIHDKIRWYEDELRYAIRLAQQRYNTVHVYLFSDHGMTNTVDQCHLMQTINQLDVRFGTDYAAVYDSTMARFWFFNERAREQISAVLDAEPRGHILTPAELAAYGCDFPDNKYGEVFFLLQPGVLLCPSFMGETPLAGMHGYDPHDLDSLAMFASNVTPDPMPQGLSDVHALMLHEIRT